VSVQDQSWEVHTVR